MICHFCNREASGKCASCGLAICAEHGDRYCQVCSEAVFSREKVTGEREDPGYLQCPPRPEMPTIYLDDDGPPECYQCQGLARKVCQNCHNLYCLEHAGQEGWCAKCSQAARIGYWIIIAIGAWVSVVMAIWLFNQYKS
jgi:hypothetical protein